MYSQEAVLSVVSSGVRQATFFFCLEAAGEAFENWLDTGRPEYKNLFVSADGIVKRCLDAGWSKYYLVHGKDYGRL